MLPVLMIMLQELAAVLEAARVLKNYDFEYTIKFTCWNAEEVSLVGSEAMAQEVADKGHTIIGGIINFDMIGRTTSEYDYLQITGPSDISGGQENLPICLLQMLSFTQI